MVPPVTREQAATYNRAYTESNDLPYQELGLDNIFAGLGADKADACRGDSGGPLLQPSSATGEGPYQQVGIVSYGLVDACGTAVNYGAYTSVAYWRGWIEDVLSYKNWRGTSAGVRQSKSVKTEMCHTGGKRLLVLRTSSVGSCVEQCRMRTACTAWSWRARTCTLRATPGWKNVAGTCVSGLMITKKTT